MKKLFLLSMIAGVFVSCGDKKISQTPELTTKMEAPQTNNQQPPMLLGKKEKANLETEPYVSWFHTNYEAYTVNENLAAQLKPLLKNVKITIFMGTWCGDSKRQVPPFYRILNTIGYSENDLTLITVSKEKNTPEKYEEGLDIQRVPTFIFYKDGVELNRIVEYPINSLEEDMLAILSGQAYKHAYAD